MKTPGKETVIRERRFVQEGTVIIREGDTGNCAFLIQSGQVKISVSGNEKKVELATMGPGQIFGEMALVFDERRTATVVAAEDCNLIVITRENFKQKLERSDPTIRAIVPMLMKRIIQANNALLNRQVSLDEMVDTVNTMYQDISRNLMPSRKKTLENTVLPKLEEFLDAARTFHECYKEGED